MEKANSCYCCTVRFFKPKEKVPKGYRRKASDNASSQPSYPYDSHSYQYVLNEPKRHLLQN